MWDRELEFNIQESILPKVTDYVLEYFRKYSRTPRTFKNRILWHFAFELCPVHTVQDSLTGCIYRVRLGKILWEMTSLTVSLQAQSEIFPIGSALFRTCQRVGSVRFQLQITSQTHPYFEYDSRIQSECGMSRHNITLLQHPFVLLNVIHSFLCVQYVFSSAIFAVYI